MTATEPLLVATNVSRRYNAVQALADASIDIRAGEVHALLGSNGAGKSTLVKILTGAVVPDTGEVRIGGRLMPTGDTRAALEAGLACIYQESNLVPSLSVLDNVMLGRQPTKRFGVLDRIPQREAVATLLAKHGLPLELDTPVHGLPTVQQKEVEIAKALSLNATVILMDEPTAWLSRVEVERLFTTIRNLTRDGVGVLYISHVLDEIFEIADRATVLRDGRVLLTKPIGEITKSSLVHAMLGRELEAEVADLRQDEVAAAGAEIALECRGLTREGVFTDIDLQVHKGEIVCITGLIGAKRSELMRCLFGSEPADRGQILVHGKAVSMRRPLDAVRRGIGLVPEDRRRDGLLMSLSMATNLTTAHLGLVTRLGLVSTGLMRRLASRLIGQMGIVPDRPALPVRNLSGGNQQKVLIGRWLAGRTDIMLLDEPTVGVDVGAKADIYQRLRELAAGGAAILVVSSDMEEVLTVADRIVVMAKGRITGSFMKHEATQLEILRAASGEHVR